MNNEAYQQAIGDAVRHVMESPEMTAVLRRLGGSAAVIAVEAGTPRVSKVLEALSAECAICLQVRMSHAASRIANGESDLATEGLMPLAG